MEELLQYEREKLLYLLRLTGIILGIISLGINSVRGGSIRFYCAGVCRGIMERFEIGIVEHKTNRFQRLF